MNLSSDSYNLLQNYHTLYFLFFLYEGYRRNCKDSNSPKFEVVRYLKHHWFFHKEEPATFYVRIPIFSQIWVLKEVYMYLSKE